MEIVDLIVIGLAITLEPIPLTAFVLVLASEGGVRKGAAFIFGWLVSLVVVVALTLLLTGNNPPRPNTTPSALLLGVKIAIGVVLVAYGARRWRKGGRSKRAKGPPKWQSSIDSMTPLFALGLAPLVQPWGLIAAGAAVISEAKLSTLGSWVALSAFCVLGTVTYLALEIYAAFWPHSAEAMLVRIRSWIESHTDQVIIVVSLGVGLWLICKSAYLIVT